MRTCEILSFQLVLGDWGDPRELTHLVAWRVLLPPQLPSLGEKVLEAPSSQVVSLRSKNATSDTNVLECV